MSNMANKKKVNLAPTQANKPMAEPLERREKSKAQVQFRHDILEFQKRVKYHKGFDRLQGVKKYKHYNLMENLE